MQRSDFYYDLPRELIAQRPVSPRSASRLLCLDGAQVRDLQFRDLPGLLRAGDLLVLNDTRVIPARLYGEKETGGRVELLLERLLDDRRALAQLRASKRPKPGQRIKLDGGHSVRIEAARDEMWGLEFERDVMQVLAEVGHVPLPPYIERADGAGDRASYQTVYAKTPGAVAAPTAGLHFDEATLAALEARGVERAFITLHVGAGTFQPLRSERLDEHRMHSEWMAIDEDTAARINAARADGGRVVAVGTTVARALETATAPDGGIKPFSGETSIFIHPPYRFRALDALLTNFHLPESTLLMLVCAFGGTERVLAAYRHAVEQRYRFYSYGDAMFATPVNSVR